MTCPSSPLRAPAEVPQDPTSQNTVLPELPEPGTVTCIRMEAAEPPAVPARVFLKNPNHTCCVGVDMPGIGHTHGPDCPAMARRAQLPETLADFASESACRDAAQVLGKEVRELIAEIDASISAIDARRTARESLFAQLLFAARDLAERNLRPSHVLAEYKGEEIRTAGCSECFMSEHLGRLQHTATCKTGRVLRIVADLMTSVDFDRPSFDPNKKEATPDGETGRVDDGIRPRGLQQRVCLKCGARGGVWTREFLDKFPDLSLLGLNQCVESDNCRCGAPDDCILHTHHCESKLNACGSGNEGGAK